MSPSDIFLVAVLHPTSAVVSAMASCWGGAFSFGPREGGMHCKARQAGTLERAGSRPQRKTCLSQVLCLDVEVECLADERWVGWIDGKGDLGVGLLRISKPVRTSKAETKTKTKQSQRQETYELCWDACWVIPWEKSRRA